MGKLHKAARNGNIEEVRQLVRTNTININEQDGEHHTALYYAAQKGHLEIVRFLRENGAHTNPCWGTPECYYTKVITAPYTAKAVEIPADHIIQYAQRLPLFAAIELGRYEIVVFLCQNPTSFSYRAEETFPTEVRGKIPSRTDDPYNTIADSDLKGAHTPLTLAAKMGHYEIARFLLQGGAKIVTPDSLLHPTALDLAIMQGNLDMIKIIIHHIKSRDIAWFNSQQDTPRYGCPGVITSPEIYESLLTAGISPGAIELRFRIHKLIKRSHRGGAELPLIDKPVTIEEETPAPSIRCSIM